MRSLHYLPGLVPLLVLPAVAVAADTATETEIVVTASRTEQNLDANLRAVTVITRDDIERLQVSDIMELLGTQAGITAAGTGGMGKDSSLFIRGGNTGHVLVLINGVRIGSATLGSVTLQDLPVEHIERIEIVRGAVSSLYGSEAISGVIQIFTRSSSAPASLSLASGNNGYQSLSASATGEGKKGQLTATLSRTTLDGIDVLIGGNQPDTDGYDNQSGSLTLSHRLSESAELRLDALRAEARNDYDAGYSGAPDNTRTVQQAAGATLTVRTENVSTHLTAGRSSDISDNYSGATFISHFQTHRQTANLQGDVRLNDEQHVVVGMDLQKDEIDGDATYSKKHRRNNAPYVQYLASMGNLDWQTGIRQDRNSQFGNESTGNIGIGYTFSPALKISGNYASAFKAPSFNDLYYSDEWGSVGNPLLQPEKARTAELGISGRLNQTRYALRAYRNNVDDLISWAPIDPDNTWGGWTPVNIGKALLQGGEIEAGTQLGALRLSGNISYVKAENRTSGDANEGKQLLRRPTTSGRLDADYELNEQWTIGSTLSAYSHRYEDAANTQVLPGYALLALRTRYQASKEWSLGIKISNATDIDYTTALDYRQPGIEGIMTVTYQPQH